MRNPSTSLCLLSADITAEEERTSLTDSLSAALTSVSETLSRAQEHNVSAAANKNRDILFIMTKV